MNTAIEFNHVSKQYRLGLVSTKTLSHDIRRFWITNILGKEDPYLKIGETNDRASKGNSEYVWALRDIDFRVEQGDVVGIIGKNGAGKSTLLKLLSRVTGPTTGTIRAHGRIGSLLEVGTGFHGEMTGRENIFMNGAILGMTRNEIQAKLDEIIDFSGCERYIDTPVKRYSSGMTVRLGFAVAAFLEPEILVVDEVLAVGDAEFQKKAIGKMKDVSQGQGRTVLFVSHNMASIRRLCKTGVVLKNGMLEFMGGVNQAIDTYLLENEGAADISLATMPRAEKTNGLARFISYEFLNNQNEPIKPHCGQPLRVRLTMEVNKGAENMEVSVAIFNSFGEQIMSFPSEFTMDFFEMSPGIHHATLNIPKLPLVGGSYRIGLWAASRNPRVKCVCSDHIDAVIRLDVEDDAFFAKGIPMIPELAGKVVLCDHNWEID